MSWEETTANEMVKHMAETKVIMQNTSRMLGRLEKRMDKFDEQELDKEVALIKQQMESTERRSETNRKALLGGAVSFALLFIETVWLHISGGKG